MIKAFTATLLLIVSCTAALADDAPTAHQQLTQQYTEILQEKQQQLNQEPNVQVPFPNASANSFGNNTANDNNQNSPWKKPATPKKSPLSSCNCYDNSDSYNYPNNFLYDADHNRTQRIDPACKCQQRGVEAGTPVVANLSPASNSSQSSTTNNSNSLLNMPSSSTTSNSDSVIVTPGATNTSDSTTDNNNNFGITY